jgi:hypothetical protein
MDQDTLVGPNVAAAQKLTQLLDAAGIGPRAVLWVRESDTALWRLWIVPNKGITDKQDFYRRIVNVISGHRGELSGLEASDTVFVADSHPAIQGLKDFIRVEGTSNVHFSNNVLHGFFLPDAMIVRMAV